LLPEKQRTFHNTAFRTLRRTNWFETVGEEVKAVRERVGLLDLTSFTNTKFPVLERKII
jgi:glycine cleavage system aminomethyltransferase T